ncbi:chloride channel protein [Halobacteriovorax sp. HLS]|uniref:chloride channel protein n=1 Tax=Halobacteriovorax sp. HLS TaxID=2234000 RepID=UPI000FD777B9|nr:chloride channel protein [Halobacteriovorax sp. HLS]
MNKLKSLLMFDMYKIGLAVLCVGVGAGGFSYMLHESVHIVTNYLGTFETFDLKSYFFAVIVATISYLLTRFFFKETHGSGIPFVKLSLVAYKGKMPKRMPFGKFLTSFFTLCSGLSFGKEGPLVTISAAWAHLVAHIFKMNRQITKVLVVSGATAGLSAAFNTPIAAVVFTIEEIMGELNTKYLGPIIVASVIASVTSYKLFGNKATFVSLNYGFHTEWHFFSYLLLGLVMSLVGFLFVKIILFSKDIRKKYFEKLDLLFVIFAVSLAGLFSQYSSEVLGDGTATINKLLMGNHNETLSYIAILFVMKLVLSTSAYSTGLSGGLFMPVLFLGAVGGSAFGIILTKLGLSGIEIGAFALLGMTSLLVSVIRAPFTAFVMLFEMTRDYELILPLMISSIAAYWISTVIDPESVYESVAEYEGVHLPTHSDNECLNEMAVEDCMIKEVISIASNKTVFEVKDTFLNYDIGGFPVLKNGRLIGVVNKCDLKAKLDEAPDTAVSALLKHSIISIYPDQSLLVALDRMKRFEIGRLPVVSRFNDKELLGIITPQEIVRFLGLSKEEDEEIEVTKE